MKTRKQFLSIITGGAALGAVSTAGAKGRTAPAETATDRDVEMENLVLAKSFCVAMRRGDRAKMRGMLSPEYLRRYGFGGKSRLLVEIAPVSGIHNIIVADDGDTVLCLYKTADGVKEALMLRTEVEDGKRFIQPVGAPAKDTGYFTPWILRQPLDKFIAT